MLQVFNSILKDKFHKTNLEARIQEWRSHELF
jgi:hypothetical protein